MYVSKSMLLLTVYFTSVTCQSFQASPLERFYPLFHLTRHGLMNILGRNSENIINMRLAREKKMLQDEVAPTVPFPCNTTGFRSEKRPTSVHQLRPGDIDVIGALGDSLTAGFGLVATSVEQVLMENRGLSWSIGGQGTWRQYVTLPNILKEFNPNLIGYSLRDSFTYERASQFNTAEGAAISSEVPYMTKILIKRITNDKRVNLKQDWKLITIMIGANDICLDVCFKNNMTDFLEMHKKDMITVLRLLRDNLPRTIINFVAPPHLSALVELEGDPELCKLVKQFECYCMFQDRFKHKKNIFYEVSKRWQQFDEEISKMPEFHQNDFEVVFQPFTLRVEVPKLNGNIADWTYLSSDCFHMSQKFNAQNANSLWNNMLERVGNKTHYSTPLFTRFLCPTKENPFIFTNANS